MGRSDSEAVIESSLHRARVAVGVIARYYLNEFIVAA